MEPQFKDGIGAVTVHTPDLAVVEYVTSYCNGVFHRSILDSICFIHGLGGGRISTWKKGEVFWPYNLLAKDIKEARIITWGYDADIAHFLAPLSANTVKDHAKSLSTALSGLRNSPETNERPIIFIAHSLGGLVCAQVGCILRG